MSVECKSTNRKLVITFFFINKRKNFTCRFTWVIISWLSFDSIVSLHCCSWTYKLLVNILTLGWTFWLRSKFRNGKKALYLGVLGFTMFAPHFSFRRVSLPLGILLFHRHPRLQQLHPLHIFLLFTFFAKLTIDNLLMEIVYPWKKCLYCIRIAMDKLL